MAATSRSDPSKLLRLPDDGAEIYATDVRLTGLFVVAAVAAALFPGPLRHVFAGLSLLLFAGGCVAFLWAFARAVQRSREELISVADVFGLGGQTSRAVRWRFHTLTALQTAVAIVTAAMRPFTLQAFGILVPMLGLGLGGLWAARHARFETRPPARRSSTARRQPHG